MEGWIPKLSHMSERAAAASATGWICESGSVSTDHTDVFVSLHSQSEGKSVSDKIKESGLHL